MQERFRMFRRAGGNFYTRDKITGQSESLGTSNRLQARQLFAARNQAVSQPQLNRTMAKAYLSAKSPDLLTRTWADVMEHYSVSGVESTRKRKAIAFRSRPFALLRGVTLMDTEAGHLLSPSDLHCGWVNGDEWFGPGMTRQALEMGTNIYLYAMTQRT